MIYQEASHFVADDDISKVIDQAVQLACRRIAPNWPLDRSIAVNPWWGFVDESMEETEASMAYLCGSRLTMEMEWYLTHYEQGRIDERCLRDSLKQHGHTLDVAQFIEACKTKEVTTSRLILITDAIDARRDLVHQPACHDVVIHAIGQHCASWFDRGQARWKLAPETSLYAAWRAIAAYDDGPSLFTGIDGIADRIAALPATHSELIGMACEKLKIQKDRYVSYFSALLLSVNGWAAWCAYLRWQAELTGGADDHLQQLLAIRLAWEWVLADSPKNHALVKEWQVTSRVSIQPTRHFYAWVWQEAFERSWQCQVNQGLSTSIKQELDSPKPGRPTLQAVFCIDVRSERFRRALEACDPSISTHGFAGFFGLPIEYQPFASRAARPQLPGLLAPTMLAISVLSKSEVTHDLLAKRRQRLSMKQAWERFRTSAGSGFGFVETSGLNYVLKLLNASLNQSRRYASDSAGLSHIECDQLHPELENVSLDKKIDLVAGILSAMSITSGFAPLVLLVGHGSQSSNNPHAAGLECGACGGQSGEINARILAGLLNQADIRAGLQSKGIVVPDDTHFVAGLHLTSTDELQLFDLPEEFAKSATVLLARQWLDEAGQRVRAERAPTLGLTQATPAKLLQTLRRNTTDWSQVRPEWGLVNNAAFIVAPRQRTKSMDLSGRSFLHDYSQAEDIDWRILEQILTAPVVVAHWINMQYYASTVDNRRWGSGNKVLHNVVGGNVGVFEGNGGDLRIGLPLQSLHDGKDWVHTPLRLSVWVEAPRTAISAIVNKQEKLHQLVSGGWLYLFSIEPDSGAIFRYTRQAGVSDAWILDVGV